MLDGDLLNMLQIAELLGVSPTTPGAWRQRGVLPTPDIDLPRRPLWRTDTIVRWAKDTERWPPGSCARPFRRTRT
jgi:hypothetical protein